MSKTYKNMDRFEDWVSVPAFPFLEIEVEKYEKGQSLQRTYQNLSDQPYMRLTMIEYFNALYYVRNGKFPEGYERVEGCIVTQGETYGGGLAMVSGCVKYNNALILKKDSFGISITYFLTLYTAPSADWL